MKCAWQELGKSLFSILSEIYGEKTTPLNNCSFDLIVKKLLFISLTELQSKIKRPNI